MSSDAAETTETENEGEKPEAADTGKQGESQSEGAKPDESTGKKPEGDDDAGGLKKALVSERDLRKKAEKEAKELRKWREEKERESLSEAERKDADLKAATERATAAEARAHEIALKHEFHAAAVAAGMNPDYIQDAFIVQKTSGAISVGEGGEAEGIAETISTLQEAKPLYFGDASGTSRKQPGNTNGGNAGKDAGGPRLSAEQARFAKAFKAAGVSEEDYVKNMTN